MTDGLNLSTFSGRYWNIIMLSRWWISNIILVMLKDNYAHQIQLLTIISVGMQILIVKGSPMSTPKENFFALFNELCISSYLYLLMCLTDFFGVTEFRATIGLLLLSVVFLSLFVNFAKVISVVYSTMKLSLRRWWRQ